MFFPKGGLKKTHNNPTVAIPDTAAIINFIFLPIGSQSYLTLQCKLYQVFSFLSNNAERTFFVSSETSSLSIRVFDTYGISTQKLVLTRTYAILTIGRSLRG